MSQPLVYLDHNVIGRLRRKNPQRDGFLAALRPYIEGGALLVVSDTNIREARYSGDPEGFAQAMEDAGIRLIEERPRANGRHVYCDEMAAPFVRAVRDACEIAQDAMELHALLLHFSGGWERQLNPDRVREDIAKQMEALWCELRQQCPEPFRFLFPEMLPVELPSAEVLERNREQTFRELDALPFRSDHSDLDPAAKPEEAVVDWIVSFLADQGEAGFSDMFPRGFWTDPARRDVSGIAGMLAGLLRTGIVRTADFSRKSVDQRRQKFLNQLRDNMHIGNAAWCDVFITTDAPACRLARAIYSWVGAETKVILWPAQQALSPDP